MTLSLFCRHLLLITWVICSFAFCTAISYAQTPNTVTPDSYTPIVGIPGINGNDVSTQQYINALYYMAISVACILAVYKIMEGGIKWMFDGLVTGKEEAKQQIQGAVFGLLIVLSAVLVLETINVNLTNINILGNAPSLNAIDRVDTPTTPVLDSRVSYPITGPVSCPPNQVLQIDSSGSIVIRSCHDKTTPDPVFPVNPGETTATQSFQYVCMNPSDCVLPGGSGWSKDGAYTQCDALSGQLDDDPSRIGWGICTYIVPKTP